MKKIKIILFIALILLLGFSAYRFTTLKEKAVDEGRPLSYREFLNLGEKTPPPTTDDQGGVYAPDFEDGSIGGGGAGGQGPRGGTGAGGNDGAFGEGSLAPKSAFGDAEPISLVSGIGSGGRPGDIPSFGNIAFGDAPGFGAGGSPGSGSVATTGPEAGAEEICAPGDMEIEFTPEEIARLEALEARFDAIAPSLRTDEGVEAENQNYQVFASKRDKIIEYQSFCFEQSPKVADQSLMRRLPTPFWNNPSMSTTSFSTSTPASAGQFSTTNALETDRFIERLFKLNIW